MKRFFKQLYSDKTARFGFLSALALSLLSFIVTLFAYRSLPPFIPIFNQLPWGEERISETLAIFIPLLIGIFIIFFNLMIAALIYQKYPLVSRMVAMTSAVMSVLVFLFLVNTIMLIT